jgi:hypothetical protein
LEAEGGDDAVNGPFADRAPALPHFLSDHLGGGVRIEKTMANDLTDHFLFSAVGGLWAAFPAEQGDGAFLQKKRAELKIALTAETELGCGAGGTVFTQLSLDQHGHLARDFVLLGDGQGAGRTLELLFVDFDEVHGGILQRWCASISLINDGTLYSARQEKNEGK